MGFKFKLPIIPISSIKGFKNGKATNSFEGADITERTSDIKNPSRGWYQIHTFQIENKPDFNELEWCIDKNDSIVLILIDIGSVNNRELNDNEISSIKEILDFFIRYKYDIILRVTYDHEGMGMIREPLKFSLIETHLAQIGDILAEFDKYIFVYQGMLVGNWGEMHTSKFLSVEQLRKLAAILLEKKGKHSFLAVRKPIQWRILHNKADEINDFTQDNMGLFDDGIFGSDTNLGTFGNMEKDIAGWVNAWNREQELEFEENLCLKVPNGGEAVYSENYTNTLDIDFILDTLNTMHISYLNKLHDNRTIEIWKNTKIQMSGVWKNKTVYEYITAHMGYRFFVKNVSVKAVKKNSKNIENTFGKDLEQLCQLEIEIENQGFANIYDEVDLIFCRQILEQEIEKRQEINREIEREKRQEQKILDVDIRTWDSGRIYKVCIFIEAYSSVLYLKMRRKKDDKIIYFANTSDEEGKVLLGKFTDI